MRNVRVADVIASMGIVSHDGPLTLRGYYNVDDQGRYWITYGVRCWDCRAEKNGFTSRDLAEEFMYNHNHQEQKT